MKLTVLGVMALIYVLTMKLAQFMIALFCTVFFSFATCSLLKELLSNLKKPKQYKAA